MIEYFVFKREKRPLIGNLRIYLRLIGYFPINFMGRISLLVFDWPEDNLLIFDWIFVSSEDCFFSIGVRRYNLDFNEFVSD